MKECQECSRKISGRSDKKFCDDGCRNAYNNRRNHESNGYVRSVNSVLRRNRCILQSLVPAGGKISVSEKTLRVLGFDFAHFTGSLENRKGNIYHFCYEYGYMKIGEGVFILVKKSDDRSGRASLPKYQVRIP